MFIKSPIITLIFRWILIYCCGCIYNVIARPLYTNITTSEVQIVNHSDYTSIFRNRSLNNSTFQLSSSGIERARNLFDMSQMTSDIQRTMITRVTCSACLTFIGFLVHSLRSGRNEEEVKVFLIQICVNMRLQSRRVCEGAIRNLSPEVIYVLKNIKLTPDEICTYILSDDCGDAFTNQYDWELRFPDLPKPPVQEIPLPIESAPKLKVLHLSDTHYDPYYLEGSNADCAEPLCCRRSSGKPKNASNAAGKWGDYRSCDSPKRLLDSMLDHIAKVDTDLDYIIWTGDLPPHDIWNQSKSHNLEILKNTATQLFEKFPGVRIFPALGNHEASPVNSFPGPELNFTDYNTSMAWLYDAVDEEWRRWLPQNISKTVRYGGFYSVLVRPGLRIISINTNFCYNLNWWLLVNSTDPGSELQWLIYELQTAELANEKVHILGHIPPGYMDCTKVWSRNFYNIINRYENTVTGQFYGHTHVDEFMVFYDPNDLGHATNIAYVGPSVSPYYDLNPGYRVYQIDGGHNQSTYHVIDLDAWVLNLHKANRKDKPIWFKLYSARKAYKMQALRPADWDNFIQRMAADRKLFDLYYRHYWKNSPKRPTCEADCWMRLICDCRSGRSHDRDYLCRDVK